LFCRSEAIPIKQSREENKWVGILSKVCSFAFLPLPARLWEQLVANAGISPETKWARLARPQILELTNLLVGTELMVRGKSMNKEEFVTCGGIPLSEVDFKTMESRIVPGLHFAGEALDIDGITGGFNFQAAWTTGWIAGQAIGSAAH
jgi:predicted Rossmann fold flavoprotein